MTPQRWSEIKAAHADGGIGDSAESNEMINELIETLSEIWADILAAAKDQQ